MVRFVIHFSPKILVLDPSGKFLWLCFRHGFRSLKSLFCFPCRFFSRAEDWSKTRWHPGLWEFYDRLIRVTHNTYEEDKYVRTLGIYWSLMAVFRFMLTFYVEHFRSCRFFPTPKLCESVIVVKFHKATWSIRSVISEREYSWSLSLTLDLWSMFPRPCGFFRFRQSRKKRFCSLWRSTLMCPWDW